MRPHSATTSQPAQVRRGGNRWQVSVVYPARRGLSDWQVLYLRRSRPHCSAGQFVADSISVLKSMLCHGSVPCFKRCLRFYYSKPQNRRQSTTHAVGGDRRTGPYSRRFGCGRESWSPRNDTRSSCPAQNGLRLTDAQGLHCERRFGSCCCPSLRQGCRVVAGDGFLPYCVGCCRRRCIRAQAEHARPCRLSRQCSVDRCSPIQSLTSSSSMRLQYCSTWPNLGM